MSFQFREQNNVFEAFNLSLIPPPFTEFWTLELPFFEPPNKTRGGWSGVAQLTLANGLPAFMKRQENHVYRSIQHGFKKRPTFEREYHNILLFNQLGLPTYHLLYFGNRTLRSGFQTILITEALTDYCALDQLAFNTIDLKSKQSLLQVLASILRLMHQHKIEHNCLYQKHIFVKKYNESWDICLIDLEKAKKRWLKKTAMIRDLSTLFRTSAHISKSNMLRFFLEYRQIKKLSHLDKALIKDIILKSKKHR